MNYRTLIVKKQEKFGIITVNRPEVRNALDRTAWSELGVAFREMDEDPDVSVIMITGAGDKAFIAGADLNALKERTAAETLDAFNPLAVDALAHVSKVTIAVINGFALGGGLEIALACDIRICSRTAKLGQTELNVGVLPGAGGTQRLSRLVGVAKAKELIFTGKVITADEGMEIGLVNHVTEPDCLWESAMSIGRMIAKKSPLILKAAKLVIDSGLQADIQTGLMLERIAQSFVFATEDHMEGLNAFLEKRTPKFTGR